VASPGQCLQNTLSHLRLGNNALAAGRWRNEDNITLQSNVETLWLILLLHIQGVTGAGYPDSGASWLSSVSPPNCGMVSQIRQKTASVHILFDSLFTDHPIIRPHTQSWLLKASLSKQQVHTNYVWSCKVTRHGSQWQVMPHSSSSTAFSYATEAELHLLIGTLKKYYKFSNTTKQTQHSTMVLKVCDTNSVLSWRYRLWTVHIV
jgi:hypothetical protein